MSQTRSDSPPMRTNWLIMNSSLRRTVIGIQYPSARSGSSGEVEEGGLQCIQLEARVDLRVIGVVKVI